MCKPLANIHMVYMKFFRFLGSTACDRQIDLKINMCALCVHLKGKSFLIPQQRPADWRQLTIFGGAKTLSARNIMKKLESVHFKTLTFKKSEP